MYQNDLYKNDLLSLIVSVQVDRSTSDGFHIDLDDFLTGLLLLANELVSLHLNVMFNSACLYRGYQFLSLGSF